MYLDTAIIIKLLIDEPESAFYQDELEDHRLSSSELAWIEVRSALFAKERNRLINKKQREFAWQQFVQLVESDLLRLHPLHAATSRRALRLLEVVHPKVALRSLDAIHLASCDLSLDFPLCTTDRRLRDAAQHLQIPLFPEEDAR